VAKTLAEAAHVGFNWAVLLGCFTLNPCSGLPFRIAIVTLVARNESVHHRQPGLASDEDCSFQPFQVSSLLEVKAETLVNPSNIMLGISSMHGYKADSTT
jgi:hypothetical protein